MEQVRALAVAQFEQLPDEHIERNSAVVVLTEQAEVQAEMQVGPELLKY